MATPCHGTKNSERRQIPIIEPMARLLQALQDGSRRFRNPARHCFPIASRKFEKYLITLTASSDSKYSFRKTKFDLFGRDE
jgi:hypothetical protein